MHPRFEHDAHALLHRRQTGRYRLGFRVLLGHIAFDSQDLGPLAALPGA